MNGKSGFGVPGKSKGRGFRACLFFVFKTVWNACCLPEWLKMNFEGSLGKMPKRRRPVEPSVEACQEDAERQSVRSCSHGLNLIHEYDEDSENEPTDTAWCLESDEQVYNKPSKAKRLEVPPEIALMFNQETDDDGKVEESSENHEGRTRSFAHVRGNWASFVYIPFSGSSGDFGTIVFMQDLVKSVVNSKEAGFHLNTDIHMSLSKTIPFRHHWLEPFKVELRKRLVNVESFFVVFDEFEVYVNDEKTRTFVGMKIHTSKILRDLVKDCDDCLKEYNLDRYYSDPSFHISLAWLLGNQFVNVTKLLPKLNEKWKTSLHSNLSLLTCKISAIEFKYGDRVSQFRLN
ncbi:unnamed protein product [Allacma fusca]|uniref:U6 snRNA phosphodiesterase n=1 Tax=Allacma fusca TaxID=39272 RepID=A0A8J2NLI6_9HEXA|nr:unnamed protein product [Allacma fusca]